MNGNAPCIVAVANQKGGCGKTTVAINLAATLARQGRRVLLVDLDPQCHCAVGLAVPEAQIDLSIRDVLLTSGRTESIDLRAIVWQIAPYFDLAPAHASLSDFEPAVRDRGDADELLARVLKSVHGAYDWCVVDCPPHWGALMRNGLHAAELVVIPIDTGYFSLHGLTRQLDAIHQFALRHQRGPAVRILANQYDVRTRQAREILAELRARFGSLVFQTVVNFNTKLREGAGIGQPVCDSAPTSAGAKDFQNLAREIIAHHGELSPAERILRNAERLVIQADQLLATTSSLVSARLNGATAPPPMKPPSRIVAERKPEPGAAGRDPVSNSAHRFREPVQEPRARRLGAMNALSLADLDAPLPDTVGVTPDSVDVDHLHVQRNIDEVYGTAQEGEVTVFRHRSTGAADVRLAGDFNDWNPDATRMTPLGGGMFEARLRLPAGRYRYRLLVDGCWLHDAANPITEVLPLGATASVFEVK